jgi:hypothetical protein
MRRLRSARTACQLGLMVALSNEAKPVTRTVGTGFFAAGMGPL